MIDEKTKIALFKKMLYFECMGETETYGHRNYCEEGNGAFKMLEILGLDKEYIEWSYGKSWESTGKKRF